VKVIPEKHVFLFMKWYLALSLSSKIVINMGIRKDMVGKYFPAFFAFVAGIMVTL
jgi:hypothetical protein